MFGTGLSGPTSDTAGCKACRTEYGGQPTLLFSLFSARVGGSPCREMEATSIVLLDLAAR